MSVTYGMNSAFKDDPYIKMGEETIKIGSKVGNVSVYMVDILPFCACSDPSSGSS